MKKGIKRRIKMNDNKFGVLIRKGTKTSRVLIDSEVGNRLVPTASFVFVDEKEEENNNTL